jgi:hypothetical protein
VDERLKVHARRFDALKGALIKPFENPSSVLLVEVILIH